MSGVVRVACLMDDDHLRHGVEQLLRLWLPDVEIEADTTLAVRSLPDVDAIVVETPGGAGERALEPLRRVRAAGFRGGVVVIRPAPGQGEEEPAAADWVRLAGTPCVLDAGDDPAEERLAGERLAAALTDALAAAGGSGTGEGTVVGWSGTTAAALGRELWETRRRLAVADVALGLQHALNNPLAALLAEAQLLELEQLLPEHRAAVHRMVALCRRMSETVRTLDVAHQGGPRGLGEEERPAVGRRSSSVPPESGRGGGEWFGHHIG